MIMTKIYSQLTAHVWPLVRLYKGPLSQSFRYCGIVRQRYTQDIQLFHTDVRYAANQYTESYEVGQLGPGQKVVDMPFNYSYICVVFFWNTLFNCSHSWDDFSQYGFGGVETTNQIWRVCFQRQGQLYDNHRIWTAKLEMTSHNDRPFLIGE